MFLSGPGARFDVVDGRQIASPLHLLGDLDELRILHHHGMHNAEERFVAWEYGRSARERIALHEALTVVFRENLNHATAVGARVLIPLEITLRVVEDGVKFVALELIWREKTDSGRVLLEDLIEILPGHFHAALVCALFHGKLLPVDGLERDIWIICVLELSQFLAVALR